MTVPAGGHAGLLYVGQRSVALDRAGHGAVLLRIHRHRQLALAWVCMPPCPRKRNRSGRRLSLILVGSFLVGFAAIYGQENMQIEGCLLWFAGRRLPSCCCPLSDRQDLRPDVVRTHLVRLGMLDGDGARLAALQTTQLDACPANGAGCATCTLLSAWGWLQWPGTDLASAKAQWGRPPWHGISPAIFSTMPLGSCWPMP